MIVTPANPSRTATKVFLAAVMAAGLCAPAAAQVQNPTTVGPGSPQNQCVPVTRRDASSATAGSPTETTVESGSVGSVPCPNNQCPPGTTASRNGTSKSAAASRSCSGTRHNARRKKKSGANPAATSRPRAYIRYASPFIAGLSSTFV